MSSSSSTTYPPVSASPAASLSSGSTERMPSVPASRTPLTGVDSPPDAYAAWLASEFMGHQTVGGELVTPRSAMYPASLLACDHEDYYYPSDQLLEPYLESPRMTDRSMNSPRMLVPPRMEEGISPPSEEFMVDAPQVASQSRASDGHVRDLAWYKEFALSYSRRTNDSGMGMIHGDSTQKCPVDSQANGGSSPRHLWRSNSKLEPSGVSARSMLSQSRGLPRIQTQPEITSGSPAQAGLVVRRVTSDCDQYNMQTPRSGKAVSMATAVEYSQPSQSQPQSDQRSTVRRFEGYQHSATARQGQQDTNVVESSQYSNFSYSTPSFPQQRYQLQSHNPNPFNLVHQYQMQQPLVQHQQQRQQRQQQQQQQPPYPSQQVLYSQEQPRHYLNGQAKSQPFQPMVRAATDPQAKNPSRGKLTCDTNAVSHAGNDLLTPPSVRRYSGVSSGVNLASSYQSQQHDVVFESAILSSRVDKRGRPLLPIPTTATPPPTPVDVMGPKVVSPVPIARQHKSQKYVDGDDYTTDAKCVAGIDTNGSMVWVTGSCYSNWSTEKPQMHMPSSSQFSCESSMQDSSPCIQPYSITHPQTSDLVSRTYTF